MRWLNLGNRRKTALITEHKSIALLDYGYITDMVLLDGYEIGYKSVEEIAEKLNHRFYRLESCNTGVRELDGEELFSDDDMERLLYSYE